MNLGGLAASAAINLGLAAIILSLFSFLRRQPRNAPVYLARWLAGLPEVHGPSSGHRRFLPSFAWILAAFRLSEEEVLRLCGLDALIVIRLFKFGIKFFSVCSVLGLFILAPVNYTSRGSPSHLKASHSLDSFTISNITPGSNRFWVHYSYLCFLSFYVSYLLHKEYKEILARRIQQLNYHRNRPDQFTVLVRGIPLCKDHEAQGCNVDHFFSKHYPDSYHSYQVVHKKGNIERLQNTESFVERRIKKMINISDDKRNCWDLLFCKFTRENRERSKGKLKELHQNIRLLQSENVLKRKELPVAFVSFKSRVGATLAAEAQQEVNPLLLTTEYAPEPNDVLWHNLVIPYWRLVIHKIGGFVAAFLLIVFFAIPVTAVQGIVQFDKIKKWFPPARAVQLIPGLNSILTGYLPSAILNGFIYLIPYAMVGLASLEGIVSKSKQEMRACSMVFYFLVGNVFFLSVLSGSLLDQIGESFAHPKDIPSHLASAVSSQSDFFITYILTNGMSGFSLEVLQFGLLTWHFLKSCIITLDATDEPYHYAFPYYRVVPIVSLAILIGMVYTIIAPLLIPFLVIHFLLGYAVYVNQMQDVYDITYDTCGQYWPYIHQYIFISVVLMQITMIGLFGLKSKPVASFCTIPLLAFNIFFNEYCKQRFLPSFCHRPIQNAKENDDLDELGTSLNERIELAVKTYKPPWMRTADSTEES